MRTHAIHITKATPTDIIEGREIVQAGVTYRVVGSIGDGPTAIDLRVVEDGKLGDWMYRSICNSRGAWGQIRLEGRVSSLVS